MEQKQKNVLITLGALSVIAFITRKFWLPTKAEFSIDNVDWEKRTVTYTTSMQNSKVWTNKISYSTVINRPDLEIPVTQKIEKYGKTSYLNIWAGTNIMIFGISKTEQKSLPKHAKNLNMFLLVDFKTKNIVAHVNGKDLPVKLTT